jgi:hypothetical protein
MLTNIVKRLSDLTEKSSLKDMIRLCSDISRGYGHRMAMAAAFKESYALPKGCLL